MAFLAGHYRRSRVALLSAPSWPLHDLMVRRAGLELQRYRCARARVCVCMHVPPVCPTVCVGGGGGRNWPADGKRLAGAGAHRADWAERVMAELRGRRAGQSQAPPPGLLHAAPTAHWQVL